ncbi:MAG: ABC transporter ATP-binding protein, partial [Clostridia bacterium]|nr:ABC transporter ATP-binding protein [Clostridia bacterium]
MLKLVNINKVYTVGDMRVEALKNVSLEFRKNEMVSILGPSGCGKTTMLNIIGGLDKYTSGDLIINGVSTKEYRECDWDAYRNASIGFVFQSYNLISHQTVLENVELALTLSGVSQSERRQRAVKALEEVGLGDQLKKKPNQLSGGQMQRVAIARALINNPDIVLADEPTGALDSVTSVQIMDLLKEVAKTRLVILVTHNGELAQQYSDRIIKLLDGRIVSDTNPVKPEGEQKTTKQRPKKTAMSFVSAFKLSIRNLFTKKMRTFITSFAGSIGIIGVALILALSSGFSGYIDRMQEDTMSSYPLTIASASVDVTSMMSLMELPGLSKYPTAQEVYINKITEKIQSTITNNEITDEYVQNAIETIDKDLVTDIVYNTGAAIN